jgi:hypothetical protein
MGGGGEKEERETNCAFPRLGTGVVIKHAKKSRRLHLWRWLRWRHNVSTRLLW